MTDDELDRALFALPLATPPAGLRERIVALTLQSEPAAVAPRRGLMLSAGDVTAIAIMLALATWLLVSGVARTVLASSGALAADAGALADRAGGQTTLLLWLAAGIAFAGIATYAPRFDLPILRRS